VVPQQAGPGPQPAAGAAGEQEVPHAPEVPGEGPGTDDEIEPHVRVDGRILEAAILALRKPLVAASLPLKTRSVEQARAERHTLLSQIDDYLLPRLRESGAPILVALVGSTGAGKSTLVNSVVGTQVSMTGIRRPTTNSPVLACHPDDVGWFAENVFLPTVPRVRQEGLARSGRDGLLVLAANKGMPKGVALLDTPDIDSVVEAHHAFAHQFLDASDLWLFMTTASRYADATVWELLQHARDRGAALALVLSRIPSAAGPEVVEHFDAMLAANGLDGHQRFLIPETVLADGKLPDEVSRPVRDWLADTAAQSDRRVAILTQTMAGVLDTFRVRVPGIAAEIEEQVRQRGDLIAAVTGSYQAALAEAGVSLADGSLLCGEVLARWQDFAGTGDLLRALQTRRGRGGREGRDRRHRGPVRAAALNAAVRASIESLIASLAARAAEDAMTRWRDHPAGAALLEEFASGKGGGWPQPVFGGNAAAAAKAKVVGLGRSSPELAARAARGVSGWQDHVIRLVKAQNVTKRSIARAVTLDEDSLATVLMVGLLGRDSDDEGTAAIPMRLLTSLFGAGPLREVVGKAQTDLRHRIRLIFDEEMLRFADVIDLAGGPDPVDAVQLYQATYALEVAR
jgi:50S ribosome-binding GTPase